MSSPAIQLTFTLRTSANVRSVHLLGSWDGYKSQLPLSMVKDTNAKPGSWKGVFRFQGSQALKLGSRYWYYYIIDGYHVSHDPSKSAVTEQTTGRKLNILDVPAGKPPTSSATTTKSTKKSSSRHAREIPIGRPLTPTRIVCPKPSKPYASRQLREVDYELTPSMLAEMEEVADAFGSIHLNATDQRYLSSPSDLSDDSYDSGECFSDLSNPSSPVSKSSNNDPPDEESESESEVDDYRHRSARRHRSTTKPLVQQRSIKTAKSSRHA